MYFLAPVWWLLVSATRTNSGLFTGNGFWFGRSNLFGNLHAVFTEQGGIYWTWLLNTLIYAGLGAALGTLFAALAGYALAKFPFRGREAVFNIVLAAVLVPQPLLAIPLYLLFSPIHLVNTYWSVLIPSMVSPFGVYLARIYAAASVPDELLEAARIDGAGEARTFFFGIVGWQQQRGIGNAVPFNIVITAAAVCVVPLVILFLSLQRFWRTGLVAGSVK